MEMPLKQAHQLGFGGKAVAKIDYLVIHLRTLNMFIAKKS
jgi:hypothetical protein